VTLQLSTLWRYRKFLLGGDIFCPLQLGKFLEIFGSFVSRVIFEVFCCDPPTQQFFAISRIFAWGGIFCPLQLSDFLAISRIFAWGGIFCPLQLGDFLAIFGSFVLRVIICAL
jgi:hypothetical protein